MFNVPFRAEMSTPYGMSQLNAGELKPHKTHSIEK